MRKLLMFAMAKVFFLLATLSIVHCSEQSSQSSDALLEVPSPTAYPSLTARPTLMPAVSAYPTMSPTFAKVSVVTYDATINIDGYVPPSRRLAQASNLRSHAMALMEGITLDEGQQYCIRQAYASSQNVPLDNVVFETAVYASSVLTVTATSNVALSGEFDGLTSDEVYAILAARLTAACNNGGFTIYLNQAASINGVSSLSTTTTSAIASIGSSSTAVYTSIDDDDQLSITDGEITATVILTCVGFGLMCFMALYGYQYYLQANLRKNMHNEDDDAMLTGDTSLKMPEVNVYHEVVYHNNAPATDMMESPRKRESIRGITVADMAQDGIGLASPRSPQSADGEHVPFNEDEGTNASATEFGNADRE